MNPYTVHPSIWACGLHREVLCWLQEPYDGQRFGLPPDEHPGDRVLHFGCGDAGLTKLLASSGLDVSGGGQ